MFVGLSMHLYRGTVKNVARLEFSAFGAQAGQLDAQHRHGLGSNTTNDCRPRMRVVCEHMSERDVVAIACEMEGTAIEELVSFARPIHVPLLTLGLAGVVVAGHARWDASISSSSSLVRHLLQCARAPAASREPSGGPRAPLRVGRDHVHLRSVCDLTLSSLQADVQIRTRLQLPTIGYAAPH